MQLVLDGRAGEERSAGGHLVENAAHAPHVDGGGVLRGAEEDVGGPVPEGHDLVRVRLRRDGLGAGQAEVGKLEEKIQRLISFCWLERNRYFFTMKLAKID